MTAVDHKQTLQHVFAETAKGNGRPFVAMLADDVTWTIVGTTAWSRSYRGKAAVLQELLGPLNAQLAGRNTITAQRMVAEDDLVAVEGQGHNVTLDGTPYENRYCWVFRFVAGRVAEIVEYADTSLIERALKPPEAARRP